MLRPTKLFLETNHGFTLICTKQVAFWEKPGDKKSPFLGKIFRGPSALRDAIDAYKKEFPL
jgi:hypothetical protein